ncbi:autophagy-related protein 13 [Elysia marginata]|uniref:Autophagy-related protein 13 n=1 Tax=Elysia marginata TaxID=1093978 RepID=A0AAV4IPR2_9GAST|nr:autophagy-related protein 13 [Elysia marginata]
MAASVSTSEDSIENIERLFKTFTFRCLQVIVYSRIEANILRSNREFNEMFNVSIPDNPAIEDSLKKSLKDVKNFPPKGPICVEVALVTSEGDHMFLETWDLSFNRSSLDMSANRTMHIFTRMGVTIKSLLSATRVLPAYKLARNQGEKGGGYTLTHRVYMGKPQTHMLGEGFKTVRAGAVPTALGLMTATVSYRTKLLLSADMPASATAAIEVKENYFKEEADAGIPHRSPKISNPLPCSPPIRSPVARSESPYCFAVSPSSLEREDKVMRARAEAESSAWETSSKLEYSLEFLKEYFAISQNISLLQMDELPEPVFGAFSRQQPAKRLSAEPEVPFEGLMRKSFLMRPEQRVSGEQTQQGDMKKMTSKEEGEEKENIPREQVTKNVFEMRQANFEEEFVMIDKPPFAEEDDPADVKAFLSAMMRAPKLYDNCGEIGSENETFSLVGKTKSAQSATVSVGQYLSDVEELVNRLEEEMPVLDEFCNSVINMDSREEDEDGGGFLFS